MPDTTSQKVVKKSRMNTLTQAAVRTNCTLNNVTLTLKECSIRSMFTSKVNRSLAASFSSYFGVIANSPDILHSSLVYYREDVGIDEELFQNCKNRRFLAEKVQIRANLQRILLTLDGYGVHIE